MDKYCLQMRSNYKANKDTDIKTFSLVILTTSLVISVISYIF